jgi:hypothetical protein
VYTYVATAQNLNYSESNSGFPLILDAAVFGATTPTGAVPVSGTASYSLDMYGMEFVKAGTSGLAADGTRDLRGNGTAAIDGSSFKGSLNGWFFGPKAQELGAVFAARQADGRLVAGTILGH